MITPDLRRPLGLGTIPLGRFAEPDEIATVIVVLCSALASAVAGRRLGSRRRSLVRNVLRDLARVDDDGYYFIVDRKKEMIIRGAFNVYPREPDEVGAAVVLRILRRETKPPPE